MSDKPVEQCPPDTLRKWPRRLITAWLLFHLIAVVSSPAAVAPASALAEAIAGFCRPYAQTLYLNHGYHYFAPDPGDSTLLEFVVEKADGSVVDSVIPRRSIWPRLLYHRHFMLTESLNYMIGYSESLLIAERIAVAEQAAHEFEQNYGPMLKADFRDFVTARLAEDPLLAEDRHEVTGFMRDWYASYADCLLHKYDGERVTLTRVRHTLPDIERLQDGRSDVLVVMDHVTGENEAAALDTLGQIRQVLALSEFSSFLRFDLGTFARDGDYIPPPVEEPVDDQLPPATEGGATQDAGLELTPAAIEDEPERGDRRNPGGNNE